MSRATMRVSKVNVGRPHCIETSHCLTKSGEGRSSQNALDPLMSALPPKADITKRDQNVCFVPKADVSRCSKNPLWSGKS